MPTNFPQSNARQKVVITGLGTVSSIGFSIKDVKESLETGKSGIVHLEDRKKLGFRSGLSGTIKNFVPQYTLDRRYRKTLPEFGIWAWDAICQALDHAGLDPSIKPLELSDEEVAHIVAFLRSLTSSDLATLKADARSVSVGN